MKNLTLFIGIIVVLGFAFKSLNAQIPNASFENWENVNAGLHPEEWQTFDVLAHFVSNQRGILRSDDSQVGSYAMLMEPSDFGDGPEGQLAFLGSMPGGDSGQISLTEKPESVTIQYKSELDQDESSITFLFYDADDQVVMAENVLLQTTDGSYAQETFNFDDLNQPAVPDISGYSIIISSHESDDVIANDYLILDEISFNDVNHQIPNGDFEDWWEVTFDEPEGWNTTNHISAFFNNISVNATSDAYTGSYAMEVSPFSIFGAASGMIDIDDDRFAFAITGEFTGFPEDYPEPGFAVSDDEDPVVSGFYKYEQAHQSDSASIGLLLYDQGEVVHEDQIDLEPSTDYTYFVLEPELTDDISFDMATVGVVLTSTESADGKITVDNLQWNEGSTNSIDLMKGLSNDNVRSYPNPVKDTWNIELPGKYAEGTVYIYDIKGTLIEKATMKNQSRKTIDLGHIDNGAYFYSIDTGDSVYRGRFVKE